MGSNNIRFQKHVPTLLMVQLLSSFVDGGVVGGWQSFSVWTE